MVQGVLHSLLLWDLVQGVLEGVVLGFILALTDPPPASSDPPSLLVPPTPALAVPGVGRLRPAAPRHRAGKAARVSGGDGLTPCGTDDG